MCATEPSAFRAEHSRIFWLYHEVKEGGFGTEQSSDWGSMRDPKRSRGGRWPKLNEVRQNQGCTAAIRGCRAGAALSSGSSDSDGITAQSAELGGKEAENRAGLLLSCPPAGGRGSWLWDSRGTRLKNSPRVCRMMLSRMTRSCACCR